MGISKWKEWELNILRLVVTKYGKCQLLYDLLSDRTRSSIDRKIRDLNLGYISSNNDGIDFNEARRLLNNFLGINKKSIYDSIFTQSNFEEYENIGVLGCLHIPGYSKKNLIKSVEICKDAGVKKLFLAGDTVDCIAYCVASHKKNVREGQHFSIKEELAIAESVFLYLSNNFNEIIVMRGNHPDRVRKWFTERVGPENMGLVNYDIISLLCANYPNIKSYNLFDIYGNELHWIMQYGDIRICHAEVNKTGPLSAALELEKKFKNWDEELEYTTEGKLTKWNVIVNLHTHQAGIHFIDSGKKALIEGGCLCVSGNSRITTRDNEYVRAYLVNEGMEVLTHRGRYRKITKVYKHSHRGEVIKISYGMLGYAKQRVLYLRLTENHPVLVLRDGMKQWVNAGDVSEIDMVFTEASICPYCNKNNIPWYHKTCRDCHPMSGNSRNPNAVRRSGSINHPHYYNDILPTMERWERDGYRCIPFGRVIPDFIAIRDNIITAVEVQNRVTKGGTSIQANYEKYDRDNYRKYYDEVEWVHLYNKSTVPGNGFKLRLYYYDKETGLIAVPVLRIEREVIGSRGKKLYNFEVEEDESYVAGGVVVHNCTPKQYAVEGSIVYDRPQTNALTLLELNDGKVNLGKIRQIPFAIPE